LLQCAESTSALTPSSNGESKPRWGFIRHFMRLWSLSLSLSMVALKVE
jgi:hypothetical protein